MTEPGFRIEGAAGRCKDCGAVATCHLQGETYSFGTEWWRLCDWCSEKAGRPGRCDWCKHDVDELRPSYRWEEHGGFGPPVYWICPECVRKERESFEAASEEWAAYME
jgi:hypothetical protein